MRTNSFFKFAIKIRTLKFLSLFLLIILLASQITRLFPEESGIVDTGFKLDAIWEKILVVIILGPLVETILFQYLVITIICRIIKRPRFNFYPAIILSAIAFAFNHNYNTYYFVYTLLVGIVYALGFYLLRYRKENGILIVFTVHGIFNFLSISQELLSTRI